MTLSPGDRLGPYEIVAPLAAGGMGRVYRAKDMRLNRVVAVKALHESVAQDPERVARFEREAQLLASLNHPNVAAIYGVEEKHGATFLVLEFVDGHSLAEILQEGPMPVREVVALARQIGEALGAAHERGIIHRDLKPGNVMVTAEGQAKVLDFGLGKALEAEGVTGSGSGSQPPNSPTMTTAATQAGIIMGTAGYMSPEQAKGRPADRRSDVWAFGCLLYEMLTGHKAFEGENLADTLAAIVRGEPDWTRLPAGLSPNVRVLLERCLIKDRAERVADMSVVRFLLSDSAHSLSGTPAPASPSLTARPRRAAPLVLAVAAIAAALTFGVTRWLGTGDGAATVSPRHVSIALPAGSEVGATPLLPIALSHDGALLAYVGLRDGKNQIFVRSLSEREPRALDGTEGGGGPFFSPDGQWLGFFADSKLKKIAVGGTGMQTLADAPFHRGGNWGEDGFIYYAPTNMGGIWRVPEGGGTPMEVTRRLPDQGEISHRWPHRVAGTKTLLFGVWTGPGDDEHHVAVQQIDEKEHHFLVKGADAPRYAAQAGVLLYTHLGELISVPWRPSQHDLGSAVPQATSEHPYDTIGNEGCGNFAVSHDGTLAYLAGGEARNLMRLVWVARDGTAQPAAAPERPYENVVLTPDGTRAIVQIRGSLTDLWTYDLGRGTLTPIGKSPGSSQAPLVTPDGLRVIYRATRQGFRNLYWRPLDGSGEEERLTSKPDVSHTPTSVSRDGRWLLYNENGPQDPGGVGAWVMRLDGDRTPRRLFASPAGELDAQFSPDGKWVAYQAPVASRMEIFVAPFPGAGPRRQISADGGTEPLWSPDGGELYFQNGSRLMSVAVTPGASAATGAPRLVSEGRYFRTINGNSAWSITPDGSRFLRIQQVTPESAITSIDLVLNWFSELRRPSH